MQVEPNFTPEYAAVNVNKEVKFKSVNNLINNPLVKSITKNLLSQEFNEFVRDNIVEKFLWHQAPKTSIPEAIKEQLMEQYYPEVIKISKLLDRDLVSEWGYSDLSQPVGSKESKNE